MSRMRFCLFFCLMLTSLPTFGMLESQNSAEARRAVCKRALLQDFKNQKEFFKGNPVVHRYLKASVSYLRAKAHKAEQPKNLALLTLLANEGFLSPAHEIQVQYNAVNQDPSSSDERKRAFQIAFDTINNTSTFFTSDNDEDERPSEDKASSTVIFKKICEDAGILDAYDQFKNQRTIIGLSNLLTKFRDKHVQIMRDYGLQFPSFNAQGKMSIMKFLELNENNPALHNPNNTSSKNLIISSAIIGIYLNTFERDQKGTEDALSFITQELESSRQRIFDGQPEVDSPCVVQ